jgi:hypothetical protein
MSPAARYLRHQRLAWLLMIYVAAVGATLGPEYAFGRLNVAECLRWTTTCAIVMACVKDSVLCGRPVPYSWRLVMAGLWPIAVPIVEWRARRWRGLLLIVLHCILLIVTLVVARLIYWIAPRIL